MRLRTIIDSKVLPGGAKRHALLSLKKRSSEIRKFYKSYLDLGVLFRGSCESGGARDREKLAARLLNDAFP